MSDDDRRRVEDDFDRALREAYKRDEGAYAFTLGLVESEVPTDCLVWATERLDRWRKA